jgi:diphthine-ammonia ligase
MNEQNFICSWSGGKDSCYAVMKAIEAGYTPKILLNILNEDGKISRSHGIPSSILQQQAQAANLPIQLISSSWQTYEQNFIQALNTLTKEYQLTHAVFGDIDLQEHRDWEEKVCATANLQAELPLWQQNRKQLVLEMLQAGIETIIVSCNETMGSEFLGKQLTPSLIETIEKLGVDACGENGEFHTLVINCPLFKTPIQATFINKINHNNYWFAQLQ